MKYETDNEDTLSPRYKEFLEELGELARDHGILGVAVATFWPGGFDLAAMGDDEHYPTAVAVVDELRSVLYLRGPPAGNG